ncbi:MAG: hypothetical protein JSS21_00025 [Proteobacteria bacterium]|nr:hypothetical protein [Pseudomonadota bacterium]
MQAVKIGRDDPRLLALQVEAMLALDRRDEANPLIKRLWTEGYRDPEFATVLEREHIDYPSNPAFAAQLLAATRQVADDGAAAQADKGK